MSVLERIFPKLSQDNYRKTSDSTPQYNCIAWAARDKSEWWWPNERYYWPDEVPDNDSVDSFKELYRRQGYQECESPELVEGIEKVAVFAQSGEVKHAARQLTNGLWTSKCGQGIDIEHELHALEGRKYGSVACIMERPRPEDTPPEA